MRMYKILFIFVIILFYGCYNDKLLKKEQIEKIINENLKYGDPETKIINFLNAQKWGYSYDKTAKRYQILYPYPKKKKIIIFTRDIVIYIYVEAKKSNSYNYAEVFYAYTSF